MGMSQFADCMRRLKSFTARSTACLLALLVLAGVPADLAADDAASTIAHDHYYEPLPQETGAAGLKLALRKLQTTGRLMQVTAHPDDEDGGMLTLEARGKGVSTLLMTLTRGEGGQNKLGSNLFDVLGVLRTLELLASDRYYGVEQRFSHVADFGYSKTAEETFQKWQGHDVALGDLVRVIRTFRPDVLIARFSGTERDGHGHHQASAILTKEAFRAAADPKRFPEQIEEGLHPWQAKKLYIGNVCGFFSRTCDAANYTVRMNTGVNDSALGTSYIQFAMTGLRHQLSQGSGNWTVEPGDRFTYYRLVDSVVASPKDNDGHEQDFFAGIDTTLPGLASRLGDEDQKQAPWLRPGLADVAKEIQEAWRTPEDELVKATGPLFSAKGSLEKLIERLQKSPIPTAAKDDILARLAEKEEELRTAIALAMDVSMEARVASPGVSPDSWPAEKAAETTISPGQAFTVRIRFHNGSKYPLGVSRFWIDGPGNWVGKVDTESGVVPPGKDQYGNVLLRVPDDAGELTRPYWHRDNPETESINEVDDERYITLPFAPTELRAHVSYHITGRRDLNIMGWTARSADGPESTTSAPVLVAFQNDKEEKQVRPPAIVPKFSVAVDPNEQVIPLSSTGERSVKVSATYDGTQQVQDDLHLVAPKSWTVEPSKTPVTFERRGEQQDFSFHVLPKDLEEGRSQIRADLDLGGKKYSEGYTLVTREDLGAAYYYQPAIQHVSVVDVKVPKDLKVGYVMGAGDDIPTVLEQIGMDVTLIPAEKLGTEDLSQYQTIVLGIRAYDTQKDVIANNKRLLDYVQAGGRLVVQYNTVGYTASSGDFNSGGFTPYKATLSRARVSVEEAPVKILDPANAVFHYPNEITQKDFDGWVQERGLYFMSQWDAKFTPLLESHDPGESEQKGGLLIAQYGKGTYIYTGYAFFRQLPAGVPGAVRLFVNLLSHE
jgi:LmbE family N-acetylglucosaminyl deacetylase